MSSKSNYIILTKDEKNAVDDNRNNQLYMINKSQTYLLPRCLFNCYVQRGLFESNLIEWVKQYCSKDKTILDIGAHTGTYAISLAPYSKKVLAFEPQKLTYYALCGSVALSSLENVDCFQYGLGSIGQVGEQKLNIVSEDGGGSTIVNTAVNVIKQEIINVRTLDSLNLNEPISLIKMDVEENELEVLKGGIETIARCGYPNILFESNNSSNIALFDHLRNIMNYRIVRINGYSNMYLAEHN